MRKDGTASYINCNYHNIFFRTFFYCLRSMFRSLLLLVGEHQSAGLSSQSFLLFTSLWASVATCITENHDAIIPKMLINTEYCRIINYQPSTFLSPAVRPGNHPGTDDVYNMTALPRGITLIVNNKLFDDHPEHGKQATRHGSEEDVRQVQDLFKNLGFEVLTEENLTRQQLLEQLDSVAYEDHSDYDCFVLWLMTHGKSGEVFCSDGEKIPIQTAHDFFSQCKSLRGKPKLFFIQACRGDDEDEGVSVTTDQVVFAKEYTSKSPASRIPKHADFLYSYSTVDDHVSYRHPDLGSYYVRALVEAFSELVTRADLLGILTNVNKRVSEMVARQRSSENKCETKELKQMPEVKHTLRKKLHF